MPGIMTIAEINALKALAEQASDNVTAHIPEDRIGTTVVSKIGGKDTLIEPSIEKSGFQPFSSVDDNSAIRVAVLDTGAPKDHPVARNTIERVWSAFDDDGADRNGHARHCGGIIAGGSVNGVRFGALPGARIGYYKVLDDSGSGTERQICRGFAQAVADGFTVISMSLGGDSPMPTLEKMIEAFYAAGGLTIAASGNGGRNLTQVSYPARYSGAIAVGSVTLAGSQSSFSQGGVDLDCVSYGEGILSYGKNGNYVRMTGTSMATPLVAAVAALFQAKRESDGLEINFLDYLKRYSAQSPTWTRVGQGHGIANVFRFHDEDSMPPGQSPDPLIVPIPLSCFPVPIAERLIAAGFGPIRVELKQVPGLSPSAKIPPGLIDPLVKSILDSIELLLAKRPILLVGFKTVRPVIEQYLRDLLGSGKINLVTY